jgi:tetratricopeptide (TPR) repeat protein
MNTKYPILIIFAFFFFSACNIRVEKSPQALDAGREDFSKTVSLIQAGQLKEAAGLLEKISADFPQSVGVQILLAQIYEKTGDHAKMRTTLDKVSRSDPFLPEVELLYARLEEVSGNAAESKKHVELAKKLGYSPQPQAGGQTSPQDQPGESQPADEEKAKAFFKKGNELFGAKQYDQALQQYNAAYKADPNNPLILLYIGDCYYALNQPEQAVAYFKKSLSMDPSNAEGWRWMGDAFDLIGNHKEALNAYKKGLELKPDDQRLRQSIDVMTAVLAKESQNPPAPEEKQ